MLYINIIYNNYLIYNYISKKMLVLSLYILTTVLTLHGFFFTGGDGQLESHITKHKWAGIYSVFFILMHYVYSKSWISLLLSAWTGSAYILAAFKAHRDENVIEKGTFSHMDFEVIINTIMICAFSYMSLHNQARFIIHFITYFPIIFISIGTFINATTGLGWSVDGDFLNFLQPIETTETIMMLYVGLPASISITLIPHKQFHYIGIILMILSIYLLKLNANKFNNKSKNDKIDKCIKFMKQYDKFN